MALQEEARIELTLLASQWKSEIKNVEGITAKSEKKMEEAFVKLARETEGAAAKHQMLGDKSAYLTAQQRALDKAITTLTNSGLSKNSATVQSMITKYHELGDATKNVAGVTDKLIGFGKQVAGYTTGYNLAVQAMQKVISKTIDLGQESVTLAASFETSRVSWGVLLGDMDKGKETFANLMSFAAKTPMSFEAINKAATTLKGFGIEANGIIPTMAKLGDVAMGNDEKLSHLALVFGQVKAQGKAMTQDLNQFVNSGVPIYQMLADTIGVGTGEIKELAAQSKITFDVVESAISRATSAGGQFYGMMDKTSQTTAGKWSTAQDNFKQILANMGEKVLPMVNRALDDFNRRVGASKKDTASMGFDELEQTLKASKLELDTITQRLESGVKLSKAETDAMQLRKAILEKDIPPMQLQYNIKVKLREEEQKAREEAEKAAKAEEEKRKKLKDVAAAEKIVSEMSTPSAEAIEMVAKMNRERKLWEQHQASIIVGEEKVNQGLSEEQKQLISISELNAEADDNEIPLYDEKIAKVKELTDAERERLSMQQEIVGGFTNLMTDTVDAMAKGEDAGKAFFKSLVSNIGDAVIAYAGLVEAQGWATFPIVDWLKVAKGVGLAVTGSAIKASAYAMANGGEGTVTKPTLFLAGEAGPEDFSFKPKSRGGMSSPIVVNVAGSILTERQLTQRILGAVAGARSGR